VRLGGFLELAGRRDDAVIPDPGVLVDDGVLDAGVAADADPGDPVRFLVVNRCVGFEVVAPHHDDAVQDAAAVDEAADPDDALPDLRR